MRKPILIASASLTLWLLGYSTAFAQSEPTYWRDIRPIFRKNCTVCHSARTVKEQDVSGGLALDSYEAVRKGTSRPILTPGKSDGSLIVHLLETSDVKKRMPLEAKPLPRETIALVRRWIDTGAREGQKPAEGTETVITKKTGKTRKLDVTLITTAVPPAGTVAKQSGRLELSLKVGPMAPVTAVAFSPDGKLLASGCYGQVTVWDLTSARPLKVLTNVLGAVNDLRFSPDGKILAVAGGQPSAKGDLRLYRVGDWKLQAVLRGHDDVIFSVAFDRDGKQLASASFDKTVRLWSVAQMKEERAFTGHSDFVYAVAFSPDGKFIASVSKDRTVKITEAATGKGMLTMGGMEQDVLAVAFSPDGKNVVSSGFESGFYWWNPQTGERLKVVGGHSIATNELCFSRDGSRLVSAGSDQLVRLWNGSSGALLRTIPVGSLVYATAISPNNKLVASGSFDGLVRLWDEASGRHLVTLLSLPAENDQPNWVVLTPQGYGDSGGTASTLGQWRLGGHQVAADLVWPAIRHPDTVGRILRGENVPGPVFTTKNTKSTKKN
jgi:WD40 repeat protein